MVVTLPFTSIAALSLLIQNFSTKPKRLLDIYSLFGELYAETIVLSTIGLHFILGGQ